MSQSNDLKNVFLDQTIQEISGKSVDSEQSPAAQVAVDYLKRFLSDRVAFVPIS